MRQSSTLNRRLFIKTASRFVGSTAAAGSLLSLGSSMPASRARSQPTTPMPEPLIQPPETRSVDGMLDTTITAAPGQVHLGERAFAGLLYNGAYVPPLLRASLGDTLRIAFRNNLTSGLDRTRLPGSCLYRCRHPIERALSRHERVAAGQQRQHICPCSTW